MWVRIRAQARGTHAAFLVDIMRRDYYLPPYYIEYRKKVQSCIRPYRPARLTARRSTEICLMLSAILTRQAELERQ